MMKQVNLTLFSLFFTGIAGLSTLVQFACEKPMQSTSLMIKDLSTPTPVPDADGDGLREIDGDCNDDNPNINLNAPEGVLNSDTTLQGDGVDNDCDGVIDEGTTSYDDDFDGYSELELDCDDTNSLISPSAVDGCDGTDNNCDGSIDEDVSDIYEPNDSLDSAFELVPIESENQDNESDLVCQNIEAQISLFPVSESSFDIDYFAVVVTDFEYRNNHKSHSNSAEEAPTPPPEPPPSCNFGVTVSLTEEDFDLELSMTLYKETLDISGVPTIEEVDYIANTQTLGQTSVSYVGSPDVDDSAVYYFKIQPAYGSVDGYCRDQLRVRFYGYYLPTP